MLVLKALTGSRLHGLSGPNSDYDWKMINVSPLKEVLSPFRTIKGKDSVGETEDECTFEFLHFAKLWASSNPTILEILWSTNVETTGEWGEEWVAGRKKLLKKDKIFYAHRGYASDQRKRMNLEIPNEHRTAKAIVAYIRIMRQGIDLLNTGDFNPVVSYEREMLLDIKNSFTPSKHIPLALTEIEKLEAEMEQAFLDCNIEFNPDINWLEEQIANIYRKT